MGNNRILTIKEWTGTGTPDLKLEIGGYMLIEKNFGSRKINKLVINRKPDHYSSRFGMMAGLNAQNRTLGWGFIEMTLLIDNFDAQGGFISRRIYVFVSVGVESRKTVNDEEELTFVFREKSEICFGQC